MPDPPSFQAQPPLVLAIDLGTGGPKVALFDTSVRLLAEAFCPVETHLPAQGAAEQNPENWWKAIQKGCAELDRKVPGSLARVAYVACTGQWSGTVALDAQGVPVHPCLTWMDSRGAGEIRSLMAGWPSVSGYGLVKALRWIRLTGGAPSLSGKDPLGHILWLKKHHPDLYEATETFLEPVDYLNFRLTGRRCASFDSITVHWLTDNRRADAVVYHEGLIRATGLDARKLPELVATGRWIGTVSTQAAAELGIPTTAQVLTACGDIHSAAVGSGATQDWIPHFYIGTSSWLIPHVPRKITDLQNNIGALPAALPGRYILANEQEAAGKCLQFLRDNVLFDQDSLSHGEAPTEFYKKLDETAVQSPAGSEGLIFFPWLNGERTPYEDHHMRGGFFNLHLRHRRCHILRSVLEGVALNARLILEALQKHAPHRIERVHMIGGGAQSALWCRITADVMHVRVLQIAQSQQCNTRGAAILALLAAGLIPRENLEKWAPVENVWDPDPANVKIYQKSFEVFKRYYSCNKKFWKQLNSS
ncbi:MAG: FGGY-family carbohydrate kinase [Flavobacteriales bacterium]|nr:FGGY-family carbohydrate kinase [Flavobacteriales bacterium]